MSDTSPGSSRLHVLRTGALSRDQIDLPAAVCPRRPALYARIKAARRQWIERTGNNLASTPVWPSRQAWLDDVASWVYSEEGLEACARCHIRPEVVLHVAAILARYADGGTGRNCAPTNRTVAAAAGCCESVVGRIRNKLLAPAGLAIEAARGSGGAGRPNRASIWHLIPRRISDLPNLPQGGGVTPVGINSPSATTRAGKSPKTNLVRRRGRRREGAPRPLPVQRLAAGLIARSVGLSRVHPGQVCDVLTRSHLDLGRWDARQLAAAMNTDMQATGLHWPNEIRRPAAFLAARLRRLPSIPDNHDRPVLSGPSARKEPTEVHQPASAATRETALGSMRATVAAARSAHRFAHPGLFQTRYLATR